MVRSNGGSGNGNGQQDYTPEVEFKYLDADVWIETDEEGEQDVVYTQDVLEALDDDDESEDDESETTNGG